MQDIAYAKKLVATEEAQVESAAPLPPKTIWKRCSKGKFEPLAVEVGLGLVKMVEGAQNSPLLRRIAGIRRQMASDLGFMVPPVRVTDNLQLKAGEYLVLLKGAEIGRFELMPNCDLAIHPGGSPQPLEGLPTREPAFGIQALWIKSESADNARSKGYTVVDGVSVLGTHLAELLRRHAYERLLSRQDTKEIFWIVLRSTSPK